MSNSSNLHPILNSSDPILHAAADNTNFCNKGKHYIGIELENVSYEKDPKKLRKLKILYKDLSHAKKLYIKTDEEGQFNFRCIKQNGLLDGKEEKYFDYYSTKSKDLLEIKISAEDHKCNRLLPFFWFGCPDRENGDGIDISHMSGGKYDPWS
eukprot:Pgem_evm1s5970